MNHTKNQGRSSMESEKRHVVSKATQIRRARNFFVNKLGYIEKPTASIDGVSLESPSGELKLILSEASVVLRDPGTNRISIYTNDCLRDYYFLKKEGVRFLNEPAYSSTGLVAEFVGHCGNTYVLVEERTYLED